MEVEIRIDFFNFCYFYLPIKLKSIICPPLPLSHLHMSVSALLSRKITIKCMFSVLHR